MIRECDKRQVGCVIEGFGEYATRWPEYEYHCHECGRWGDSSNVTHVHDDGSESPVCPVCADRIIASGVFDA